MAQPIGELENVLDVLVSSNWKKSPVRTIHVINIPFSVKPIRNMLQKYQGTTARI
jgi:hypothetical protein